MRRREFIRSTSIFLPGIIGGGLGCSAGSRGESMEKVGKPRNESIVIVGAGAAGIGAAEELRRNGFRKIRILEARDRVGGRVWTSQHWEDTPVDMGASWIHGIHGNPIQSLTKKLKLATLQTNFENVEKFDTEGRPLSAIELAATERIGRRLYRWASEGGSLKGNLLDALESRFLGLSEVDRRRLEHLVDDLIEKELADDAEALSGNAYAFGEEFGGPDVLFPNGYAELFSTLGKTFEILTGQNVQTVRLEPNRVILETFQETFDADRVILTLPLGVLKSESIRFEPELPAEKKRAIDAMGMGCLNKVYLRFPEGFWPAGSEGFSYRADPVGHWSQWFNFGLYVGKPILVAFNSGAFARELESWENTRVVSEAVKVLRRIYGASVPEPIDYQITRWASDPFSLGSYSCLRPGVTRREINALGRPIHERLFFAGEATSLDYPSTVHGAYISGQREARRVAKIAS